MRIYYFSGATIPSQAAKSVHVMKMCQAWSKLGHDVTLFGKGDTTGDIKHRKESAFKTYGVDNSFTLSLTKNIKIPLLSGLIRLFETHKALKKMPAPDLAYARDPIALALFAPKQSVTAFELHQMPYLWPHKRAIKSLSTRDRFKGIICISENLRKDFLAEYPDFSPERVFVAHDGADLITTKPKEKPLLNSKGRFNAGYAGSLHEGKGADFILEIATITPDIDFHIFGGTQNQIKALKAQSTQNVYFYGHVDHSDLAGYMQNFNVALAPYQKIAKIRTGQDISRWVSPMKLFEYMAAKKAVLCSDLPVIREILTHKKTAILLPPDDPNAWQQALHTLKNNKGEKETLAENALNALKDKYTWNKRAENILKTID